jgi:hypothetical protein
MYLCTFLKKATNIILKPGARGSTGVVGTSGPARAVALTRCRHFLALNDDVTVILLLSFLLHEKY